MSIYILRDQHDQVRPWEVEVREVKTKVKERRPDLGYLRRTCENFPDNLSKYCPSVFLGFWGTKGLPEVPVLPSNWDSFVLYKIYYMSHRSDQDFVSSPEGKRTRYAHERFISSGGRLDGEQTQTASERRAPWATSTLKAGISQNWSQLAVR